MSSDDIALGYGSRCVKRSTHQVANSLVKHKKTLIIPHNMAACWYLDELKAIKNCSNVFSWEHVYKEAHIVRFHDQEKNKQENIDKKIGKPMVWLDLLNLFLTYSLSLEKECNSSILLNQTILSLTKFIQKRIIT